MSLARRIRSGMRRREVVTWTGPGLIPPNEAAKLKFINEIINMENDGDRFQYRRWAKYTHGPRWAKEIEDRRQKQNEANAPAETEKAL